MTTKNNQMKAAYQSPNCRAIDLMLDKRVLVSMSDEVEGFYENNPLVW